MANEMMNGPVQICNFLTSTWNSWIQRIKKWNSKITKLKWKSNPDDDVKMSYCVHGDEILWTDGHGKKNQKRR